MKRRHALILAILLALAGIARADAVKIASGKLTAQQAVGQLNLTGAVEAAGLTLNNVQIEISGGGSYIHGLTLTGNSTITIDAAAHDVRIVYNTFACSSNAPIRGFPSGSNIIIEHNSVDTRGQNTSGNDNHEEWLHLVGTADHLSVSNNHIESNLLRWAIELQSGMTNLKVDGNYIHAAQGGSGISAPVGGDAKAPFSHAGENVDVSGNVVLIDAAPAANCSLEIDGDKNIVVHDNYLSGGRVSIVNGTGGQNGGGLVTHDNTLIVPAGGTYYSDWDNTPWPVPPRISTNDKTFKVGDASAPKPPAAPTDVGAASDGIGVIAPQVVIAAPAIDLGLKATSTVNTITWTFAAQTAPATLTLVTPGNGQVLGTAQIAAGTTSYTATGLAANWVVNATLATPAGQQALTAQCLARTGDFASAGPISTPSTPGASPDLTALEADAAAKLQVYQTAQAAYIAALKAAAGK